MKTSTKFKHDFTNQNSYIEACILPFSTTNCLLTSTVEQNYHLLNAQDNKHSQPRQLHRQIKHTPKMK